MSEKKYSFKEALMLSVVAGLLGALPAAISAYQATISSKAASNAEAEAKLAIENFKIRQARLAERDRVNYEHGIDIGLNTALLIPVSDNDAWRRYVSCMDEQANRLVCMKQESKVLSSQPLGLAKEPIK